MTITELALLMQTQIHIKYMVSWMPTENPWCCNFKNCEVKEGRFLRTEYGVGATPQAAIESYVNLIKGSILVDGAFTDKRKEWNVPDTLTVD